ncbi:hypothetical protein [Kocuria rhizosphaericola]|uniref:hypothetical protein n=1 Tax=Kocuria rhizosphaericola TaxID=3376284 RepID=UPI0037AA5558
MDALSPSWTALGVTGSALGVRSMILDSLKLNWDSITPTFLPSILERTLPGNLVPLVGSLDLEALLSILENEGTALGTVPSTPIAATLLDADSEGDRRAILGRRLPTIIDDCDEVAHRITTGPLASAAQHLSQALAAARSGHPEAAQALLGNVLDTALRRVWTKRERDLRTSRAEKNSPTTERFMEDTLPQAVALLPVWAAYAPYQSDKNGLIPHRFNRHATAHSAGSRRQYNRRNTAQAALVASSVLAYLHAEARV